MQPDVTAPGVDILAATSNSLEKKENPFVLVDSVRDGDDKKRGGELLF